MNTGSKDTETVLKPGLNLANYPFEPKMDVTSGNVHEHPLFAKFSIHDSLEGQDCTHTFGLLVWQCFWRTGYAVFVKFSRR